MKHLNQTIETSLLLEEQKIEYIIECKAYPEKEAILQKLASIKYKLPLIHSYVIEIQAKNVAQLKQIPDIRIFPAYSTLSLRMNQARKMTGADLANQAGLTGKNIGIAILDTGISSIADFQSPNNRIIAFHDFIHQKKEPYDDNGHGTHVAGIAAGNGFLSHGKYAGIAPEANLIGVKILDENGQGNSVQALAGIQWIIDNRDKYNIKVANLSIGTNDKTVNLPLLRAVNAAWEAGIVMVSAAGNTDSRRGTVNSPGISRKIITVGTYEQRPFYTRNLLGFPIYNTPNQWADLYAPGTDIISCLSPDYSFRSKSRDKMNIVEEHYIKMSGTSMATPMVSGAIALLLEEYPLLSPNQIKYLLKEHAFKNKREGTISGLLNIKHFI